MGLLQPTVKAIIVKTGVNYLSFEIADIPRVITVVNFASCYFLWSVAPTPCRTLPCRWPYLAEFSTFVNSVVDMITWQIEPA